jgi:hypothetical protein
MNILSILYYIVTEVAGAPEASLSIYQNTRCHNPFHNTNLNRR